MQSELMPVSPNKPQRNMCEVRRAWPVTTLTLPVSYTRNSARVLCSCSACSPYINTRNTHTLRIIVTFVWYLTYLLEAITVEPEKQPLLAKGSETTFVSRQRLSKRVPAATDTHATIEVLLNMVFSTRSMQRGYCNKEDKIWVSKLILGV
jgi:hypothetical protein